MPTEIRGVREVGRKNGREGQMGRGERKGGGGGGGQTERQTDGQTERGTDRQTRS